MNINQTQVTRRELLEMLDPWIEWLMTAEYEQCQHHWVANGSIDDGFMNVTCAICGEMNQEHIH